ncbi:uncharacterized protein LOC134813782 [Bolinopsis microptera]|uniref:uncharacterized protein LOC134813782 n=1 Tax=Bolinopsis microptera TaxID=2820187 RepID=UPI003079E2F4
MWSYNLTNYYQWNKTAVTMVDQEMPSSLLEPVQTVNPTETWAKFPEITDSPWKWTNDGARPTCNSNCIQFLSDKTVKWNKEKKSQGYWKLDSDMKILETKFHGAVHELRYIVEERKAVVINCGQNVPGAIWETVTSLSDYERRGKEIATFYCSTEEELSVMSPPAPQQTYKDRYPDNTINEDPRITDNKTKQQNYEAEVIVYRALEMLKERLIVLHGFKFTHYQYTLCDRNHDRRHCGQCKRPKNSEECDFLIIGEGFFVVIEVKNPASDGNPTIAFKGS